MFAVIENTKTRHRRVDISDLYLKDQFVYGISSQTLQTFLPRIELFKNAKHAEALKRLKQLSEQTYQLPTTMRLQQLASIVTLQTKQIRKASGGPHLVLNGTN